MKQLQLTTKRTFLMTARKKTHIQTDAIKETLAQEKQFRGISHASSTKAPAPNNI